MSPHLREVWEFDDCESQPSARRQKHRCRLVNEHLFRQKRRAMLNASGMKTLTLKSCISLLLGHTLEGSRATNKVIERIGRTRQEISESETTTKELRRLDEDDSTKSLPRTL
jgi:hypothetical protein